MKRLLLGALLLLGLIPQARAQDAQVISSCGSPPTTLLAGSVTPLFVDITGKLCSNAAGGGGSPGGLSGAVQFNSSGSFGGITGVTTNGTNLTISSTLIYSGAAVGTQVACLGLDASNNVVKNAAACGSGGGGTPGGSSTQLQYNAAGSFGGVAGATTNGTVVTFATNDLSLAGATSGNTLLNATAAAGAGTVATFPANTGTVAELNLAQTWSAVQTFSASNGIVYSGATVGTQVACIGLDGSNNLVKNAAACGLGTVTSVAAGCGTSSGGSPITTTGTIFAAEVPNLRAGTTYTIANADCGTLNNFSNAAAIAVTLPQAGSGGNFANGWYNDVCSIGAGTATITPTTSTIGGVATLVLTTGKCARIVSDGTNYQVVTYGGGGGGGTPGGAPTNVQFNSAGSFGGDAGFTYTTLGQVTIAGGTITTNNKALTITQTWNNAATTFDASLLINVTNTASNVASSFLDIQSGGTSLFSISQQSGTSRATISAPQFSNFNTNGALAFVDASANNIVRIGNAGAASPGIAIGIQNALIYGSGGSVGSIGGGDTQIFLDGSGSVSHNIAIADYNNAVGVGLRIYNSGGALNVALPTNYERGVIDWTTTANTLTIGTQAGGTGSGRPVLLVSAGLFKASGPALPTCAAAFNGAQAVVSDATAPTYNATYTSGGAIVAHVVCNGTNWVTQ
jgi:hypothetical protein